MFAVVSGRGAKQDVLYGCRSDVFGGVVSSRLDFRWNSTSTEIPDWDRNLVAGEAHPLFLFYFARKGMVVPPSWCVWGCGLVVFCWGWRKSLESTSRKHLKLRLTNVHTTRRPNSPPIMNGISLPISLPPPLGYLHKILALISQLLRTTLGGSFPLGHTSAHKGQNLL